MVDMREELAETYRGAGDKAVKREEKGLKRGLGRSFISDPRTWNSLFYPQSVSCQVDV